MQYGGEAGALVCPATEPEFPQMRHPATHPASACPDEFVQFGNASICVASSEAESCTPGATTSVSPADATNPCAEGCTAAAIARPAPHARNPAAMLAPHTATTTHAIAHARQSRRFVFMDFFRGLADQPSTCTVTPDPPEIELTFARTKLARTPETLRASPAVTVEVSMV